VTHHTTPIRPNHDLGTGAITLHLAGALHSRRSDPYARSIVPGRRALPRLRHAQPCGANETPGLARIASAVASSSTADAESAFAYPDPVALIKAVMVPLEASAEDLQACVDFLTADPPSLDCAPTTDMDESQDETS
jgi:hypothetical protein